MVIFLSGKAEGFTKRSYPEGHMVCGVYPGEGRGCAANRTAQRIYVYHLLPERNKPLSPSNMLSFQSVIKLFTADEKH